MSGLLIESDRLFQTLLEDIGIPGATVAADLDTDSFNSVPFITHTSFIGQDRNAYGLWSCTLTITAHIEASTANFNTVLRPLYAGIHAWGESPLAGIVEGVGAVESIDQDIQAFTRLSRGIPMLTKVVTPYVGSFGLSIRNH